MSKTLKILSIDGGGIRGLYSLYVLKAIENKFCINDESLADYFDMICGTSIGGIIALAITCGKKIDEIITFFEDNAKFIFPNHGTNNFTKKFKSMYYTFLQLCGSKYGNDILKEKITNFFEKKTLGEANTLLCIPSYNIENAQRIVFKFPHKEGKLTRDKNILMYDVALSTSAAPTYFPIHYMDTETGMSGHYIDGGVWANDPTLVGIIEACDYFVGNDKDYDNYDILSIGNFKTDILNHPTNTKTYWNCLNFDKIITVMFNCDSTMTEHYCKTINKITNGNMTRIYNRTVLSSKDADDVKIDNSNDKFMEYMKISGQNDGINYTTPTNDEYGKNADIARFFNNKKTYITTIKTKL